MNTSEEKKQDESVVRYEEPGQEYPAIEMKIDEFIESLCINNTDSIFYRLKKILISDIV